MGALAGRADAGLAQELNTLAGILREALKASRAVLAELRPPERWTTGAWPLR